MPLPWRGDALQRSLLSAVEKSLVPNAAGLETKRKLAFETVIPAHCLLFGPIDIHYSLWLGCGCGLPGQDLAWVFSWPCSQDAANHMPPIARLVTSPTVTIVLAMVSLVACYVPAR